MFLGLRTAIYPVADVGAAKAFFTKILGVEPNFDEPFYVGYTVAGYELGIVPKSSDGEPMTYWGVPDVDAAVAMLIEARAAPGHDVTEVGGGIRVAAVREPSGNLFGVIENPHFALEDAKTSVEGPGR
jgi:catechol 2,3-dioxygenase-like lactoylglutathione lyase family enzyme